MTRDTKKPASGVLSITGKRPKTAAALGLLEPFKKAGMTDPLRKKSTVAKPHGTHIRGYGDLVAHREATGRVAEQHLSPSKELARILCKSAHMKSAAFHPFAPDGTVMRTLTFDDYCYPKHGPAVKRFKVLCGTEDAENMARTHNIFAFDYNGVPLIASAIAADRFTAYLDSPLGAVHFLADENAASFEAAEIAIVLPYTGWGQSKTSVMKKIHRVLLESAKRGPCT